MAVVSLSWRIIGVMALLALITIGILGYALGPVRHTLQEQTFHGDTIRRMRANAILDSDVKKETRLKIIPRTEAVDSNTSGGEVLVASGNTADMNQSTANINPIVVEIVEESERNANDFVAITKAIEALSKLNSADARDALRRIALGDLKIDNPNLQRRAARSLILSDRNEAWSLLSSANPELVSDALIAVLGLPVTRERIASLRTCLNDKVDFVQWGAINVLAAVPAGELADEAVERICESLAMVKEAAQADLLIGNLKDFETPETHGERMYRRIYTALVGSKIDNAVLHRIALEQSGRARETIFLALAERGDNTIHDSIVKIAQDPDVGMFRAWAAIALRKVGVTDDLVLLQRLAETDPLFRPSAAPTDDSPSSYPVRLEALQAMRVIQRRQLKK